MLFRSPDGGVADALGRLRGRVDAEPPLVALGVYAPAESAGRVGDAAVRTLGLDIDDTRVRDARPGIHATLDEFQ